MLYHPSIGDMSLACCQNWHTGPLRLLELLITAVPRQWPTYSGELLTE
jgi:hypothetical protein